MTAYRLAAVMTVALAPVVSALPAPTEVSAFVTQAAAYGITVDGTTAYISIDTGLEIADISDVNNVAHLGFLAGGDQGMSVTFAYPVVFLSDMAAGVQIIDASAPADPTFFKNIDSTYASYRTAWDSDLMILYVADGYGGLKAVDLTNLASPVSATYVGASAPVEGVFLDSGYAYIASGSVGINILNVADMYNMVSMGTCDTVGSAVNVVKKDQYLFIADYFRGVSVFDASDFTNCKSLWTDQTFWALDIKMEGNYIYVAAWTAGVVIYDISDPTSPTKLYTIALSSGRARGIDVLNGYIYVATDSGRLITLFAPMETDAPGTPSPPTVPSRNFEGCLYDDNGRFFSYEPLQGSSVDIDSCLTACFTTASYLYAGLKNGNECYCSNTIVGTERVGGYECDMACPANSAEICGGYRRISAYAKNLDATPKTETFVGCFEDSESSRQLSYLAYHSTTLSYQECIDICRHNQYEYAGLQNGNECWCGSDITSSQKTITTKCSDSCPADGWTPCGGYFRNAIYAIDSAPVPVYTSSYVGCYEDLDISNRAFQDFPWDNSANTVDECAEACAFNGYAYAGVEYGTQCFCDNSISSASNTGCDMQCSGDNTQTCGGSFRMSVYSVSSTL
eukprot:TRINITY_DN3487_c0_g6_i1.p1 TRINITY_DN3487_c0_g6~~TRINITY_DN3487_c0_g6_i1.p1  ORF type:complete len:623 (+),score=125.28 TRINITY_DN3487_c0_g6_i1:151-2019(+)